MRAVSMMLAILLFWVIYIPELFSADKINIAIADFESRNVSMVDAAAVADFIRTEMVRVDMFNVLERSTMSQVLAEQKFQMSGCTTQECAVKMGRLLNARYMIIGILTNLAGVYYITASIIDVETGKITISERVNCKEAEELADRAGVLAGILSSKLIGKPVSVPLQTPIGFQQPVSVKPRPAVTRIIEEGRSIAINRGILDGIKKRDIFDIYGEEGRVSRVIVKSIGSDESVCGIAKIEPEKKIMPGNPVLYKGKRRVGGIGVYTGFAAGNLDPGFSGGVYYEYISLKGIGFRINLGSSSGTLLKDINGDNIEGVYKEELLYYDDSGNPVYKEIREERIWTGTYALPIILKYHISRDSNVSFYGGIGISQYEPKYERLYYDRVRGHWKDSKYIPYSTTSLEESDVQDETVKPLLNAGVNFLSLKGFHISFDLMYLIGNTFREVGMSVISYTWSVSTNW